jgi:hypothetical protein
MNEADSARLSRLIDNEVEMLKAHGWTEEARRHDFAICTTLFDNRVLSAWWTLLADTSGLMSRS